MGAALCLNKLHYNTGSRSIINDQDGLITNKSKALSGCNKGLSLFYDSQTAERNLQ